MTHDEIKAYIEKNFGDKLTLLDTGRCEPIYEVKVADLHDVARALRDDQTLKLDYLCNLGGTDTGERLEAHYNLASITNSHRVDLKVILSYENPSVPSLQDIWPAANWYEREMWELFGVNIDGHNNLTRFLLPDDWDQGHPMLKNWDAPDFIRLPEFEA